MLTDTYLVPHDTVGVVVIGRNEGLRLRRCIASLANSRCPIVYVDSGSTDDSVSWVRSQGVDVVELDMSIPFCAARARNAGYHRLAEASPRVSLVQFVDGDCELIDTWICAAANILMIQSGLAVVAGWVRERSPEASIYNRIADLEWNLSQPGEVESVGGIFMVRRTAFDQVGGFDPTVPAGEEPELCQRLRTHGWRINRLDIEMAKHDLSMTHFQQWWRRMIRYGYGSQDVAVRFAVPRFRHNSVQVRVWTFCFAFVPIVGLLVSMLQGKNMAVLLAMVLLSAWPVQATRIAVRLWRQGHKRMLAMSYAVFLLASYFPQLIGQSLYWSDRLTKRHFRLVEYKGTGSSRSKTTRFG